MTRFIPGEEINKGKHFLEVGPGTGPFTKVIARKLGPNDKLDLVEINPVFYEQLKNKYSYAPNIAIQCSPVTEWKPSYQYDVIISSLPFNAFAANQVEEILRHYQQLAKPGGTLSYFEYCLIPKMKKLLVGSSARRAYHQTFSVMRNFEKNYEISGEMVWTNIFPATVHHCQFADGRATTH